MGILVLIIVGLIAAWLASVVMRGGGAGIVGDFIVGVVGAVIGGLLAFALPNMPDLVFAINITSIFAAFFGAMILIALLRMVSGRSRVRG